jgi:acetoacetyl-CoA reductase
VQNKVALVTGGSGGIGTAICQQLHKEGVKVANACHQEEKGKKWQEAQRALGFDFFVMVCDVSDPESCTKMVSHVEEALGPIDVLVNNAGITRDAQLKNMTYTQWDAVLRTNLDSLFNVTRPIISSMIQRNYGRVISISSINGEKGQFGQVNYSAAKAGVHGFTMALAQEVAKKGITVNTVSPGYIATEMVMAVPEEIRQKIIAQIPVGRLGYPQEIARLISFLASPDSGFITGANFSANGGQHMH